MIVRYLTEKQMLLLHAMLIEKFGGTHGVRDPGVIKAIVAFPKQTFANKELYPSLFSKAAVYARSIIVRHPFMDGNKRTAITTADVFLENNGYIINVPKGELAKLGYRIVTKKMEPKEIATWLKKNSKKIT